LYAARRIHRMLECHRLCRISVACHHFTGRARAGNASAGSPWSGYSHGIFDPIGSQADHHAGIRIAGSCRNAGGCCFEATRRVHVFTTRVISASLSPHRPRPSGGFFIFPMIFVVVRRLLQQADLIGIFTIQERMMDCVERDFCTSSRRSSAVRLASLQASWCLDASHDEFRRRFV